MDGQTVRNVELRDLRSQLLPMVRLLHTDGCQVFRSPEGDELVFSLFQFVRFPPVFGRLHLNCGKSFLRAAPVVGQWDKLVTVCRPS